MICSLEHLIAWANEHRCAMIGIGIEGCAACEMMEQFTSEIAAANPEAAVSYKKIDPEVEDDLKILGAFQTTSFPSLYLMERGRVRRGWAGFPRREDLEVMRNKLLEEVAAAIRAVA